MPNDIESIRRNKLLTNLVAEAAENLTETLLETCADQEYRLCCLELGIN